MGAGEDNRLTTAWAWAAALVGYAALALWWIFHGAEQQLGFGNDFAFALFFGAVGVLHLVTGYVVRSWWVLALPVFAVLAAVPAGYPDANRGEPFPIWLGLALFGAPLGLLAAAVGVALGGTWIGRSARD